jgi:hypothetical protein
MTRWQLGAQFPPNAISEIKLFHSYPLMPLAVCQQAQNGPLFNAMSLWCLVILVCVIRYNFCALISISRFEDLPISRLPLCRLALLLILLRSIPAMGLSKWVVGSRQYG